MRATDKWAIQCFIFVCGVSFALSCGGGGDGGASENPPTTGAKIETSYEGQTKVRIDFTAQVQSRQKATYQDIQLVEAKVTYLSLTRTIALVKVEGTEAMYEGVIDKLPLGIELNIEILAKDKNNQVIFRGEQNIELTTDELSSLPISMVEEDLVYDEAPIIEGVRLLTHYVNPGDAISLEVIVKNEKSFSDPLSYKWFSEHGRFSNSSSKQSQWFVPGNEGSYKIFVDVTNGYSTTQFSFDLTSSQKGMIHPEIIFAPILQSVDAEWASESIELKAKIQSQSDYVVNVNWLNAASRQVLGSGNTISLAIPDNGFDHDLFIELSYVGETLVSEYAFSLSELVQPKIIRTGDYQTYVRHKRVDVSDGSEGTYFITEDRTLWKADRLTGTEFLIEEVLGMSDVIDVDCAEDYTLALKADGSVWGWGSNIGGVLTLDPSIKRIDQPVQLSGLSNIVDIAAGFGNGLALNNDGEVFAWGDNAIVASRDNVRVIEKVGLLGTGNETDIVVTVPSKVLNLPKVSSVAAGHSSFAVLEDGTVMAWGYNLFYSLGSGYLSSTTSPIQLENLSNVKHIESSRAYSLALLHDGTMMHWGTFTYYAEGVTLESDRYITPEFFLKDDSIKDFVLGLYHGAILTHSGEVKSWGSSVSGGLALGGSEGDYPFEITPKLSPYLSGVRYLGGGFNRGICITSNGSWYFWGNGIRHTNPPAPNEYSPVNIRSGI